ncbi:MAG: selenium cofactor biosynthesis protein YqeC [Candidatus Xenobia bacterium]
MHLPPGTISISGSGGKTTLLLMLARDLFKRGKRVIVSTTTRVRSTPFPDVPEVLPSGPFLYQALGPEVEPDKFAAPSMEKLEAWSHACDYLLLETDGARGHSLKRYRPDEPVLPPWPFTPIVVVGMRPGPVYRDAEARDRLEVVFGEGQYFSRVGRAMLVLSQADDPSAALEFLGFARLAGHLDRYVSEAFLWREPAWPRWRAGGVAAVLLAAGRGSRMGRFKLLESVRGKPLVQHALDALFASPVDEIVLVTGHGGSAIRAAVTPRDPRLRIVCNERYEEGMATSLSAGIAATPRDASRCLVALGDMPALQPETIHRLLAEDAPIVAPSYQGRRGHPVAFGATLRNELTTLQGDVGAREVLLRHGVVEIDVDDPGVLLDVDTPADLDAL